MSRRGKKLRLFPLEHFTKIKKTAGDDLGKRRVTQFRWSIDIEQRRARDCANANLEFTCHPRMVMDLFWMLRGLLMRFGDQFEHAIDCKSKKPKGKPTDCTCGFHYIRSRLHRFTGNPDE